MGVSKVILFVVLAFLVINNNGCKESSSGSGASQGQVGGENDDDSRSGWVGARTFGEVGKYTVPHSMTIDSNNNVFVVAYLGPNPDAPQLPPNKPILAKYDSNGVLGFKNALISETYDLLSAESVTHDSSGKVFVAGYREEYLSSLRSGPFFMIKLSSNGDRESSDTVYAPTTNWTAQNRAYGITRDQTDSIYVAGSTTGPLEGNTLTGWSDIFVTKYVNGAKQWTTQVGVAAKNSEARGVVTDASNVYVVGSTDGGLDGGSSGTGGAFVAKFSSDGTKSWIKEFGTYPSATKRNCS